MDSTYNLSVREMSRCIEQSLAICLSQRFTNIPTTLVVGFVGVEKNSELQCLRYYVIMVIWRCDAK